jgi:putative membrane protein insertion efficiency factor
MFRPIITKILLGLIKLYQTLISPLTPSTCRFQPTCSHYAKEAIVIHGARRGSVLTLKRLFKCHPWGKSGYDPVPPKNNKN